jgi:hypothetical protein
MLLLGRPSGAIYGIHKRLLDARRPFDPAGNFIEGLVPYLPMLPVIPTQVWPFRVLLLGVVCFVFVLVLVVLVWFGLVF